jgi:hypothetical protein
MLLLDQKASDILSKITFAKERVKKIKSPDNILETYIEPLEDWLNTLEQRAKDAKKDFEEFVRETNFIEESYLQEEPQRRLLADILRDFEDIERRFYISVDAFLPLIPIWSSQKRGVEIKRQHSLLVYFVIDLLELSHISESMMAIIGEDYACLPLSWGQTIKHVVFGTYSEIENLRKWVLLAHEVGHAYYDLNAEKFSAALFPQVIRKLIEVKPINLEQRQLESVIYTWTRNWIPELVADCFAVKTLGPPFITQFMLTVLDSQPNLIESTHPPSDLRVGFMMDILDSLSLPDDDTKSYRNVWRSYCYSVSRPSSLYIIHEEVVKTALNGIDSIVQEKPIKKKWTNIQKAKRAISDGALPDQDLLCIVSAFAISEPSIDFHPIYKELLKRHSSNSYAL